jgi:error-prone DNA polymerase
MGVSDPEELIEESIRLGLDALAITDHDGFYAASRFAEAALAYDLRTIYGAELSLGLTTPTKRCSRPRRSASPSCLLAVSRDTTDSLERSPKPS